MLQDKDVLTIISAGVLLGRAAEALSDFEAETVAEIGRRFAEQRRAAVITEAEWEVVRRSIDAMRVVIAHRLATAEAEAA